MGRPTITTLGRGMLDSRPFPRQRGGAVIGPRSHPAWKRTRRIAGGNRHLGSLIIGYTFSLTIRSYVAPRVNRRATRPGGGVCGVENPGTMSELTVVRTIRGSERDGGPGRCGWRIHRARRRGAGDGRGGRIGPHPLGGPRIRRPGRLGLGVVPVRLALVDLGGAVRVPRPAILHQAVGIPQARRPALGDVRRSPGSSRRSSGPGEPAGEAVSGQLDPAYVGCLSIGLCLSVMVGVPVLAARYLLVDPSRPKVPVPSTWTDRLGLFLTVAWPHPVRRWAWS